MDKLVELIGKILEKLTSAKLIWTIIIAIAIFGLTFALGAPVTSALGLGCLKGGSTPGLTPTPGPTPVGPTPIPTATPAAGAPAPAVSTTATSCAPVQVGIGIAALAAVSLILSAIIVWLAGFIKNKYFV